MVRIAFWAALAIGSALAAGCGPGKELPDDIPDRTDSKDTEPAVPKESEPAAKEYLAKAARALTGGKPELVQRAKVSRASFKGGSQLPTDSGGLVRFAAVRTVAAVWPDRVLMTDDLTLEQKTEQVRVTLHRPRITVSRSGREFPLPNPAETERVVAFDSQAQYWLALGLPLTDPAGVAFGFKATPGAPTFVRLALPTFPPLGLYFDPATDRLRRVEYTTMEQGRARRKEWALTATKPDASGVHLPHTFEFRQDGVLVEEWTAEKWEFPDAIPDAEFAPKK
jgi:hypothetical protein